MLKNIILIFTLCLTVNISAQENSFFNKTYPNSNANLELGIGYLFKPNAIRYQVASRNILLNKKVGFMYTIESNSDGVYDIFGINYRISNNLSFQAGSGLSTKSIFNSEGGIRKEISLAYHPDYMPLTITTGYSKSFGPSFTVNYRIFFNKKKNKEKIKKSAIVNKNQTKKKVPQKNNTKINERLEIENKKTIQEEAEDIAKKQAAEKAAADAKKKAEKAMADAKKLCDESEVLYPLNMYDLSSSEKKNLQKLAQYLKTNPKIKLQIFGSTDKSGSEEYNIKLGAKRTNISKNYLIQLGVSSKQLETINLGESKSQNSNSEQEREKSRSTTYRITPLLP